MTTSAPLEDPQLTMTNEVEDTLTTESKIIGAVHEEYDDDDDDDEDECRICRGPAEEGCPLFSPCQCSGSIKRTHQKCLEDWLAITRKDKCEVCGYTFCFEPLYAEGAPETLPLHELIIGFLSRATGKWLPFAIRAVLAISLWLCIIPLATAYLYYGWIHRPSAVMSRLKLELIPSDTVSGAIIAAVIIVSFLSLMSFADFLRFHWQQIDNEQANANMAAAAVDAENEVLPFGRAGLRIRDDIDVERLPARNRRVQFPHRRDMNNFEQENMFQNDINPQRIREDDVDVAHHPFVNAHQHQENADFNINFDERGNDHIQDLAAEQQNRIMQVRRMRRNHQERVAAAGVPNDGNNLNPEANFLPMEAPPDRPREANPIPARPEPRAQPIDDRFEPQFVPLEPVMDQDEPVDIHVALDELLGFRGPIGAVVRNVMWLLVFNTIYLGLFAFIPHTIGHTVYSILSRKKIWEYLTSFPSQYGLTYFEALGQIISKLNSESLRQNAALQLPDLGTIVFGYLFMGLLIYLWKALALMALRMSSVDQNIPTSTSRDNNENPNPFLRDEPVHDPTQVRATFTHQFKVALECAVAIVKVGVILFLKMLLLPLLLGLWLDAATLSLFDKTIEERVMFSAGDLFGSILLHWVIGITFMLLVTVSVLQLREVVHPNILAKIIRPQEPQPDFLGNLLSESGITHAKRMLLSLAIYIALLTVHVWLPAKFLVSTGLSQHLPFFRPRICHFFLPQLQMPVELLLFHLCMLAFLEKYKNHMGKMQHIFFVKLCGKMNISEYILPHSVNKFVFLGVRPIYQKIDHDVSKQMDQTDNAGNRDEECLINTLPTKKSHNFMKKSDNTKNQQQSLYKIDPFWLELSSMESPSHEFITSNIEKSPDSPRYETGITKGSGKRVLNNSQSNIRLARLIPSTLPSENISVPASIGAYRLRRCTPPRLMHSNCYESYAIEFWKEVRGDPVPRPPEGWDDLGVGGAEVQGRWAWDDEKCSEIEEGVATRTPFMQCGNVPLLVLKVIVLTILFWFACVLSCCTIMNITLFLGRVVLSILRIPDQWVHDPFAFAIGAAILLPIIHITSKQMEDQGFATSLNKLRNWASSFRPPESKEKLRVLTLCLTLWLFACPLCIGMLFDLFVVSSRSFWSGNEPIGTASILRCWVSGFLFLHAWATLCYLGAFTKEFWLAIGVAFGGGEGGNNGRAQGPDGGEQNNVGIFGGDSIGVKWQGKDGRIAVFWDTIKKTIFGWEWDKVDRTSLLDECAFPIVRQIATPFLGSILSFAIIASIFIILFDGGVSGPSGFILPFIGYVDKGLYFMILFRTSVLFFISSQIATGFNAPLQRWYQVAHKAARDDRYLIGETLMDYSPSKIPCCNSVEKIR